MTDMEPRRLGDALPDELISPEAANATAVLRIFRAANLTPSFGFDMADAVRLWGSALAAFDQSALLVAANEWVSTAGAGFPTLAEFEELVVECQRRRATQRPQSGSEPPPGGCPECGNTVATPTDGWVMLSDPERSPRTLRPCSLCNPDGYELWRAGHFEPRSSHRCRCRHALCKDNKTGGRK
jgi:hypothetical protein